jgi:hypothetical protein
MIIVVCVFLLSDAEGGKDSGQHIFGGRLSGDLAEKSEGVVEPDQDYLLAHFLIQQGD